MDRRVTSYYPATCLEIRGEKCRVMHQSKNDEHGFGLIEDVPMGMVRLEPPQPPNRQYSKIFVGDIVDCKHDGGWWRCKVTKKDGHGVLTVTFEYPALGGYFHSMMTRGNLMLHQEWNPHIPGQWILSNVFERTVDSTVSGFYISMIVVRAVENSTES
ncbi:hypothetical protein LXL04_003646 [Taraxacum kok-saghyz]